VLGPSLVGPHPIAVAVDIEDDRAMEEPIEHRRGDRRVVEDGIDC